MLVDMSAPVSVVVAVVIGYLLGSIPVARLATGRDLRTEGDGNPGYWNAKQTLGRRAALPVFAGDMVKGAAAAGIGWMLADQRWWVAYVAVGAAMVGHAWPVFDHFRGGRSVLTWAGGAIVLSPLTAALAIGALAVAWLGTRSFAVAARVGIVAFPVSQLLVDGRERTAATGALMCIFGLRFVMAWRRHAAA
jgi:glycerol-3-phosphate acyltransferase PlsY